MNSKAFFDSILYVFCNKYCSFSEPTVGYHVNVLVSRWVTSFVPFLDDLFKVHKLKPNVKWRQAFEIYLKTMPPYYLMVNESFYVCFHQYLSSKPVTFSYVTAAASGVFWQPLKKALRMMGAPNLIAENMDCGLSYSVISYLKKLSQQVRSHLFSHRINFIYVSTISTADVTRTQLPGYIWGVKTVVREICKCVSFTLLFKAKLESDRLIVSVGKKAPQEIAIKVKNQSSSPSLSHYCDFKHLLQGISGEGPLRLADIKEFSGFQIALLNKVRQTKWPIFSLTGNVRIICWMIVLTETTLMCPQDVKPQAYRNAFDIPRRNLLDHLTRMRSNLLQRFQKRIRGQDEGITTNPFYYISLRFVWREFVCSLPDSLHSVPVAQMGNYQEYLKMMPSPLRELDPDQPKRLHTFGNPFKQDKKVEARVEPADVFLLCPAL